jgi:predicted TPR repeat methyltransferase
VTEWKLFDEDNPPEVLDPWFLSRQPWMDLENQPGFGQRAALVTGMVRNAVGSPGPYGPILTVTDLGCGDGSMMWRLRDLPVTMLGYELGAGDFVYAQSRGLDVRRANILDGVELNGRPMMYGDLVVASEVVEHIADPVQFLRSIPGGNLIVSSPSLETGEWHNGIHVWAWDEEGYADMVRRAGWDVFHQESCAGGLNTFSGVTGEQRFQCIWATR